MAREGIFPDAKLEKIAELPGAVAGIMDRVFETDRYLQWLEKASPQTPNLKNR